MAEASKYEIGARNPNTLPGPPGNESWEENERRTRIWNRIRREVQHAHGQKYVV